MRLDKFLSEMGIGTRSEVKKLLKSKKVTVKILYVIIINSLFMKNMNIICFISLPDAFRLQRIIFTKLSWIT